MSDRSVSEDAASRDFLRFAQTRDTDILDRLLHEYLDRAYGHALRMLGNASDAEDVVQESFIRLVRTADRYDGAIPFGAWLNRLIYNQSINAMRSKKRRRRREQESGWAPSETPPSADEESQNAVRAAVRDLPDRYRATIDLHYFAGLSLRDIGLALGMTENTVAVRLHRAREQLRSLLQRRGTIITSAALAALLAETAAQAAPRTLAELSAETVVSWSGKSGFFSGVTAVWLGTVLAALVAGTAWHALKSEAPEGAAAVSYRNDFDRSLQPDAMLDDFQPGDGWHWFADRGVSGGCIETAKSPGTVRLAVGSRNLPVKIAFKGFAMDEADTGVVEAHWDGIAPTRDDDSSSAIQGPGWNDYVFYVTDKRISFWRNAVLVEVVSESPQSSTSRLQIRFVQPIRVDDLVIGSIPESEIPKAE